METSSLARDLATLSHMTVLLVDDQRFVRSIVRSMLSSVEGLVILEAESGKRALEILAADHVDIVVMDINMPDLNGLQARKAIRTSTGGVRPLIPVVMLTSLNDMAVVRSCGELDCQGFLLKPVSKTDLISKLARALEREWTLREPGHYWGTEVPAIIPVDDSGVPGTSPGSPDSNTEPRPGHEFVTVDFDGLKPNDILVRDMRMKNGSTMANAGTALSKLMIDRLQDLRKVAAFDSVEIERAVQGAPGDGRLDT